MGIAEALPAGGIGAPKGFDREVSPQGVRISWRRHGDSACLWAGLLGLALCALLVAAGVSGLVHARAWGLATGALAAGSIYLLVAGLLNRTVVSTHEHRLTVGHRPIPCPWPAWLLGERSRRFGSVDIYRVWAEEQPAPFGRDGDEPVYDLLVMTIDAGRKEFLKRLSADEAAYLAEELRVQLGLQR